MKRLAAITFSAILFAQFGIASSFAGIETKPMSVGVTVATPCETEGQNSAACIYYTQKAAEYRARHGKAPQSKTSR